MAEIQEVSIKHEAIMDFLMSHPNIRLSEVANNFGITQGWLSQIIHSDVFQLRLREKQGVAFHSTVLPLREKMLVVAHQALDKLSEQIPLETDTKTLSTVADNVLEKLGFSSKAPTVQVNNTQVNVLRSEIEEARALLHRRKNSTEVVIDGASTPLTLPAESFASMGEASEGTSISALQSLREASASGGEV